MRQRPDPVLEECSFGDGRAARAKCAVPACGRLICLTHIGREYPYGGGAECVDCYERGAALGSRRHDTARTVALVVGLVVGVGAAALFAMAGGVAAVGLGVTLGLGVMAGAVVGWFLYVFIWGY